ncbi:PMT-domain-containing protein [Neoconidiobolus thromboides FSU 785]|nr:PMT-domain-containing protein [Neoconidiobolus thromboides FSU 785]
MEIYPNQILYQRGGNSELKPPIKEDESIDTYDSKQKYEIEEKEQVFNFKPSSTKNSDPLYFISDTKLLFFLTLLSFLTRLYNVSYGNRPIWDEVHFGKFGSFYLQKHFYNDVHPPLAKLLIALGGYLVGYDGTFDFESDENYTEGMNYTGIRVFCAIFGIAIVPLGFAFLRKIGVEKTTALITGLLLTFDNGLIVISKFILLDPFLLFFSLLSIYCLAWFNEYKDKPFSQQWWISLFALGTSVGLNNSIKWGVPLFLMSVVGIYTINDLGSKFFDKKMTMKEYLYHWIVRIGALIIWPIIVYLISFEIHFKTLTNPSDDVYVMDSVFLARLPNSNLTDINLYVSNHSNITLRASKLEGRMIYTFNETYKDSNEQIASGNYLYEPNSYWTIYKYNNDYDYTNEKDEIYNLDKNKVDLIEDNDIVLFYNQQTNKYLKVNENFNANLTKDKGYQMIVKELNNKDKSYLWKIKIIDDRQLNNKPTKINAITTRFQLINLENSCKLGNPDKRLPGRNKEYQELVCFKDKNYEHIDTYFNIEYSQHENKNIKKVNKDYFKRRYWYDLYRIHHAMWSIHGIIKPSVDHDEPIESRAKDWPLLFKGIRMSSWGDEDIKFFMIGNISIWWLSTFSVIIYPILYIIYSIRFKYGIIEWTKGEWNQFQFIGQTLYLGWFIHYIPFFVIGRVLYLHHYFPPLMFAIMLTPYTISLLLSKFKAKIKYIIHTLILIVVLFFYFFFFPFTYGFNYPAVNLKNRRLLSSWYIYDEDT